MVQALPSVAALVAGSLGLLSVIVQNGALASAKLPDRGRIPSESRQELARVKAPHGPRKTREGSRSLETRTTNVRRLPRRIGEDDRGSLRGSTSTPINEETQTPWRRNLSSQLTGCCTDYSSYSASDMCGLYGQDCESGQQPSHDSGDGDCSQAGLSFIGISFSVNTAHGNPYSYQLCDQFAMENIIDRDYEYVMSMDEDGWLVGGGYKNFDYSGKMPYIDSSHTELLRIGSLDPDFGGTTIEQVYEAMDSLSFPPFAIYPEFVKGGGGGHSGDDGDSSVPSGDVTLIVSVVDTYEDGDSYSSYEDFLDNLFDAMDGVGGGPCMDDHDTDPHVSMARGVKFKSSYHQQQYFYKANLEVSVWQAMYPKGVVIGSNSYASFPPDSGSRNKMYVGYGNLYFFFDRANITKAFEPNRELSSTETSYATIYSGGKSDSYYESTTTVGFDYNQGSGSNDNDEYYEHNPYNWKAEMANHDFTDGWDLPPNCEQEGETFFGIPLSQRSDSKLLSTNSFQDQFDFEYLTDRNFTYMQSFGTNHGWLVGETLGNGAGSIVDKDTAHIPSKLSQVCPVFFSQHSIFLRIFPPSSLYCQVFFTGTTNPDMVSLSRD
ncbi:hypothetical protein THAOC_29634 [Thalassiosira oceanica]|uniref:Uncharacterized protein n=1 Tax=Thalassiosira oceanica TaxID=159749 RepID=K0RG33_THAOC|nr:hypothetical protein THAOC_29634 [Thalassiosira oceanica]|eukprot:EJK51214.1 hypothetical protein THAOC_29634 [Thalassiosira oceanica]